MVHLSLTAETQCTL